MIIILIIKVYTCNNVYLIVIIVMQFAPLPHLSAIVELCFHKGGGRNLGIIQESELQTLKMKIDFSGKNL